jgi:hypothetical protein
MQKGRHWILVVSFACSIYIYIIITALLLGSPSLQRRNQRISTYLPGFSCASLRVSYIVIDTDTLQLGGGIAAVAIATTTIGEPSLHNQ